MNNNDRIRINEQIRISPVVLIDRDGKNLGSVPLRMAMDLASESKLDLVEIAPGARPPVCRLMDYGKFKFEQGLKEKKLKKNQAKSSKVKEIRLSPAIGEHDMDTKSKAAIKFLKSGYKINVKLEFRRRQMVHQDIGIETINSFLERISSFGKALSKPKIEGKSAFCTVEPLDQNDASGKIL